MARVSFTSHLARHVACPPLAVRGETLAAVLQAVFAANPPLQPYLVDDQGRLRRHVTLFINDRMIADRAGLTDPVGPDDDVYVFQALSGG